MVEVDLKIDELSVPELLEASSRLAAGLTDNEHFPSPQPPAAELQAFVEALESAQDEYRQQRQRLDELRTARDAIIKKLQEAVVEAAAYVQEVSEGDAKKILSANLHFEHKISLWPFGGLEQVGELSASAGDQPGEVDLVWDRVRGADGYEVELSRDISPHGPWEQAAATTQSKTSLEHLTSRQRYWFRVRAVSENSTGDWSDPVTKFAR